MSHLKAVTCWLSTGFSGFLRRGERSYSWMLFMGCLHWLAARCQCCLPLRGKKTSLKSPHGIVVRLGLRSKPWAVVRSGSCALLVGRLSTSLSRFAVLLEGEEIKSRPCNQLKSTLQSVFARNLVVKQRQSVRSKHMNFSVACS